MPLAADRASISVAPVRFRRNRWLPRRHSGITSGGRNGSPDGRSNSLSVCWPRRVHRYTARFTGPRS